MVKKPERVCHFQKLDEVKTLLGKVTEYKNKCELTARKSSWIELFLFHFSSTEFSDCNPEKCPIYQTYLVSSKKEDTA